MLFIVDGEGKVSKAAAMALLTDIIKPYNVPAFVTPYKPPVEGDLKLVENILELMDNVGVCQLQHSTNMLHDLSSTEERIFIVLGADTRRQAVGYCLQNNIQILDLERGLYPVTSVED